MPGFCDGRKEDRRIAKTKKLLKKAMLELMDKKPLDHITISTLCEHVDISRNTFYYHYAHIGELLDDIISDNVEALGMLSTGVTDPYKSVCELYGFIVEHKTIYMELLVKNMNVYFHQELIEQTKRSVYPALQSFNPDAPEERKEILASFVADAFTAAMLRWLRQGYEEAPKEEVELLIQLLNYGVYSAIQ